MRAPDTLTCAVCDADAESVHHLSECFECARWFHLNPYSNQPGQDCGDASIGPTDGIETYCNDCIEAIQRRHVAAIGSERARAESMAQTMFGGNMPLPPASPGGPTAEGTRRFRRIDDE